MSFQRFGSTRLFLDRRIPIHRVQLRTPALGGGVFWDSVKRQERNVPWTETINRTNLVDPGQTLEQNEKDAERFQEGSPELSPGFKTPTLKCYQNQVAKDQLVLRALVQMCFIPQNN